MAKGVKKIKWVPKEGDAKVFPTLSIPNKLLVIEPDKWAWFEVSEWEAGTTDIDKKKDITWIRQSNNRKIIINQLRITTSKLYGVKLTKKLCGPYAYYIEASLSGKSDSRDVGLRVRGHCEAKIISSKWCATNDGEDQRSKYFKYGHLIYLNLETEGLNGINNLIVDVYKIVEGGGGTSDDKHVATYTNVQVIDGEVNLKMGNTSSWFVHAKKDIEEFYVKVKAGNRYITDGKDAIHARFLRMKRDLVTPAFEVSTNNTPLKVGESGKNHERYEPCKFDAIKIKDVDADKKPVTVTVFEGGKTNGKSLEKLSHPEEKITKSILFEFDSAVISAEGQKVLNNVLQFLLEHQHSKLHLSGYACVIGKEAYNQPLSERRANAVKKVLADGKLDPSRIIAKGYGEAYHKDGVTTPKVDDDKKGADNIKHKTKTENVNARRVDVSFTFYGHDANTMVYETIAPSVTTKKELEIEIIGFDTKKCFQEKIKQHKQETRVIDIGKIENDGNDVVKKFEAAKFPVKVYSDLRRVNLFPLEFIWPASTTPNKVYIHTHSCRWYSNPSNATVLIKVYPDIKWDFHFFLNLSNELSVKWQNLSPAKHKEMQSKAGKIGAEKRWKQTEVDFGVTLEANWDKVAKDKYNSHVDATLKYEEKIKQFYSVFASLKEFSKGVTGGTAGVAKKSTLPYDVQMKPPNFCLGAIWQLERGSKNNILSNELGTEIKFYFKAEPLIALVLTIDLLDLAVQAAGTVVGGPAGNFAAKEILKIIKLWAAKDSDLGITFKILFDLILTGQIDGSADMTINTASDDNKGKAELKTKLSAEIKLEVELKAKAVILEVTAYAAGTAKASAKASLTFGHSLDYNQYSKSLYYQPEMKFDTVEGRVLIKIEAGLSSKKLGLNLKDDATVVDDTYTFWEGFDVIKKFEKTTGYSTKINLI